MTGPGSWYDGCDIGEGGNPTAKALHGENDLMDAGVRLWIAFDPVSGKLDLAAFPVKVTLAPAAE